MQFQPQPVTPDQTVVEQNKAILSAQARKGTDWFFWIAGLSLINTITSLLNLKFSFIAGLAITQFIDAVAIQLTKNATDSGKIISFIVAFCIDLGIAGLFILAGFLARKQYRWIVVAGMALYALDALVLLIFQDWIPFLFHGWALWNIWLGLQNLNKRNALEKASQLYPSQF